MGVVKKSMMEYLFPTADGTISNIAKPAVQANNFEIKPAIIQIIRSSVQFSSLPDEDPNKHLANFLEICDTFRFNGVSDDAVRLRIFPFSLCDTAKDWLQSLPAGSITTWAALTQKFLAKYFPPAKTAKMSSDITSFVQLDREPLYDAWERFKSMLKKCPHHELPVWRQVQTFYNGVTLDNRATIDAAAGGTIMKKLPLEAFNIIDEIATNLYSYGQERTDKRAADIHNIDAVSALSAQMTALTQIVNNFRAAMWNGAPIGPCGACGQMGHWSQDCKVGNQFSIHEDANFVSHDGRHLISKSRSNDSEYRSANWAIGKHSLWKKRGQLPSDIVKNPREQVNAISVNNGQTIENEPPKEQVEEAQTKKEEESQEKIKGSPLKLNIDAIPPYIPYPKRILKANLDKQFENFLEILKKIHVNIPLIDALLQMRSAKFLKEVLSNKRKWEEGETVKLNEECSAILQNKLPPKFKDPGSFSIPCTIGNIDFDKVLCHLGASVNLMPYSIFEKLGMHELTPSIITLQLADRSIKYPRGIVEDVLKKEHDIFAINNINTFGIDNVHLVKCEEPKGDCIENSNGDSLQEMKEEHEEVLSFVDTEQEVKSKLQKESFLNGSTSNPKVKPPFEVLSDRKQASEGKWGRPNRMKRWRNQVDENVGFYKEHTKAWNESHMKKKKFKDGDKRHHKNKGPIKVD
ncbi:UNVERIFIED_CONTAM: hypothetical protein Slati_3112900 [Sesamum latifolium]|uniref:CCHC-type domain-containing protein n=1 Tax=Sesamum latifolium TaxID=2727402 RepID=A0AAW2UXB1_9LAMI